MKSDATVGLQFVVKLTIKLILQKQTFHHRKTGQNVNKATKLPMVPSTLRVRSNKIPNFLILKYRRKYFYYLILAEQNPAEILI